MEMNYVCPTAHLQGLALYDMDEATRRAWHRVQLARQVL